jgi:hypothetical protein
MEDSNTVVGADAKDKDHMAVKKAREKEEANNYLLLGFSS